MVSIVMPVYNEERLVAQSIYSALGQDYEDKEIVVIDDHSTDRTFGVVKTFPVSAYQNETNLGLAGNLDECFYKSKGKYIVILCGDDVFTHPSVISDMVKIFEDNPKVGVIGRYYYQYLNGHEGAVMTIRGDIYTSSCQPSGIGFRREAYYGKGNFSPKLFVEVPSMVKRIIERGWEYDIIKYDTIAARLHPGVKGNAASAPSYYKSGEGQSPTMNWYEILGKPIGMYLGFIQIKNRAPWMLKREIRYTIMLNKKCLLNIGFWTCALTALLVPGSILRPLANFYRHRITRHFCKVIERGEIC